MRHLVLGSLGRRISWMLVWALVLPLLALATPQRQARAQTVDRTTPVAVVDFGVLVGNNTSAILGRSATDAVVVELTRSGRFDVIPRTQLNQQLQDLGLTAPLSTNGILKLGQALGVQFIVTGDVTGVSYTSNPRRAKVTLSVRVIDVVTGELTNGAIETGFSPAPPPGMTVEDETLTNQALSEAATSAVRTINNYQLPEATILQTRDEQEVTLNRGGRDGITPGLPMVVTRGGERVGTIRVSNVESTSSIATITDIGKGIRPEDRARAIFNLPGYSVDSTGLVRSTVPDTTTYAVKNRKSKPVLVTVLAIAAAVLLATYLFSNRSNLNNASGTGSVTARAYAEGSVVSSGDTTAARVEVKWTPASGVPVNNILEYQIFRDGTPIGVTTRSQTTFTDRGDVYNTVVTLRTITFGDNANPIFPGDPVLTGAGTTTGTTNTTTNTTTTTTTGGVTSTTTNGTGGLAVPNTLRQVQYTVPALQVGVPHRYSVRVLYQQVRAGRPQGNTTTGNVGTGTVGTGNIGTGTTGTTGTGGNSTNTDVNQILYRETALSSESGNATPIVRPATVGPTTDQNLKQVQVTYQTVTGADQYVIEFASDPSFKNKKSFGPFYQSVVANATAAPTVDVSSFQSLPSGSRVYFRVGARASTDSPGPLGRYTPNSGNYIYSANSLSFTIQGTPPAPPTNPAG